MTKEEGSKRVLARQTPDMIGQTVHMAGWVHIRRDHGKLIFIDLRDRSGLTQIVIIPQVSKEAYDVASTLRSEDVISITGLVKARPEKLVNTKLVSGTVEIEAHTITLLSKAETMPFDMGAEELNLELPTLLDYRTLTLRHPKVAAIFKVQEAIAEGFRKASKELDCTEIFIPTITASSTEGGTEVFGVDYYTHKAYLAQSPQLFKQMMVGVFERVYMFSHAYRAEPSVTTRHLSEVVQIDIEIGFTTFEELLDSLEFVGKSMVSYAIEKCQKEIEYFGIEKPLIPTKVPRLTLREAQAIVEKRTGRDLSRENDLNPEDEREICIWSREEHKSDFVTITHFPTKKKPFYTHPDPKNPEYSLSYDLLFKGREISSGSRRVNEYQMLLDIMKERGMSTKGFEMYLQAFKYGIPPEGGFSFGVERLTQQLLDLPNIREASLFPRDMERVDFRFSDENKGK